MTLHAPSPDTPAFGWTRAAESGCTFRRLSEADLPFLGRLYASTRIEELAPVPWSEADKAAFLEQQFRAQHAHYQQYYPNADWLVITHGGEDIGRLYIERWPSQHRVIDIAFMPAHRGKGYGEALLRDAIDEAADAGKDVSIMAKISEIVARRNAEREAVMAGAGETPPAEAVVKQQKTLLGRMMSFFRLNAA